MDPPKNSKSRIDNSNSVSQQQFENINAEKYSNCSSFCTNAKKALKKVASILKLNSIAHVLGKLIIKILSLLGVSDKKLTAIS